MEEITIRLPKVSDVHNFSYAANKCKCKVTVIHGEYQVNGKSLLGLFSLDLDNPVKVVFSDLKDGESYIDNCRKWMV